MLPLSRVLPKAHRVSYRTDPWRWRIDNEDGTATGWTYYYTFYAYVSQRPGTTRYSVVYATTPDRIKISTEQHYSTDEWKHKLSFWAYDHQQVGTICNSVAYAESPFRHRISKYEHKSTNGWTHLFTFWAFPNSTGSVIKHL